MPIYEFKCESCENIEEMLLKFSEPKPTVCPKCGGALHQMISQTSFALKGSGWYVTDYKGKSGPDAKPAEVKPETKPAETAPKPPESSAAAPTPVAPTPAS